MLQSYVFVDSRKGVVFIKNSLKLEVYPSSIIVKTSIEGFTNTETSGIIKRTFNGTSKITLDKWISISPTPLSSFYQPPHHLVFVSPKVIPNPFPLFFVFNENNSSFKCQGAHTSFVRDLLVLVGFIADRFTIIVGSYISDCKKKVVRWCEKFFDLPQILPSYVHLLKSWTKMVNKQFFFNFIL